MKSSTYSVSLLFRLFLAFLLIGLSCTDNLWSVNSFYSSYSLSEGLSDNTVKAIYQDSKGFMWFGTKDGLNRFDGVEMRTYRYDKNIHNIVFNNDITYIVGDSKGYMWIGTFNGVLLFDPYKEQFVDLDNLFQDNSLLDGVVTGIYLESDDKIWVSTKKGIFLLDKADRRLRIVLYSAYVNRMNVGPDGYLLADVVGRGLVLVSMKTGIVSSVKSGGAGGRSPILDIFKDSGGQFWLGGNLKDLFLYDVSKDSLKNVGLQRMMGGKAGYGQVHCFMQYNDSVLLLGTDNGYIAVNQFTGELSGYNDLPADRLDNHRIMSMYKDVDGGLWIGTYNKGLKYWNADRYDFKSFDLCEASEASAGRLGRIVELNGRLWISCERGISVFDMETKKTRFCGVNDDILHKETDTELYFLSRYDSDSLFLYLLNEGLFGFDASSGRLLDKVDLPSSAQVRSMVKDRIGNFWIAEENLSVLDVSTGKVSSRLKTNEMGVTNFTLTQDLLLRKNGNILVGTRTTGIWEYIYDADKEKCYTEVRHVNIPPLSSQNVNTLYEDSQHRIWVGTYNSGVYCCDLSTDNYVVYDVENGLSGDMICGIVEDKENDMMWIATVKGLSSIHVVTGVVKNYLYNKGFPLQEIAVGSFLMGSDGNIYIGGSGQITVFDPSTLQYEVKPRPVHVMSVAALGTSETVDKLSYQTSYRIERGVEFPYNQSSITIKYASQNYIYPLMNEYEYRMKGLDEKWYHTENSEITYTNLSPGTYTFEVRSVGDSMLGEVTRLQIHIAPPLWLTIWAKILYAFISIGLLAFFMQYFMNRKTYKYKQRIAQVEKENLEKYYQMKLDLFTKFSHELRTPLSLIVGPIADIQRHPSLPHELKFTAELIQRNVEKLLLLVNQLLDFRKMDDGFVRLNKACIDVNRFVIDRLPEFMRLAGEKSIEIAYQNDYPESKAFLDANLMEKVLWNILSNAIKYTPEGGRINIRISVDKERLLHLEVRDTGIGISKSDLEHIFELFYQVDRKEHMAGNSSGIGLNLVYHIVKLHGGEVKVRSELGRGSTFDISLPIDAQRLLEESELQPEENQSALMFDAPKVSSDSVPMEGKEYTVLVIEDDDELRTYIRMQLENTWHVIEAADGKEGYEKTVEFLPDLVLSDVMMPNLNGIELCDLIKENHLTAHVPVVLLTARVLSEQIKEGYRHRADDYILKPFDVDLLKLRIKNLIDTRVQLRELFSSQLSSLAITAETQILETEDALLAQLIRIIEERISEPNLSVQDLCVELGMSRAQFFRKIKAVSNVTPNKLLLQIRMKAAVSYLLKGNTSVSEVAYKVGFSDPAYFAKSFKAVYNITPSDFLKQKRGED